jgi:hypothetical protein
MNHSRPPFEITFMEGLHSHQCSVEDPMWSLMTHTLDLIRL